jgi:hypothetical protein
VAARWKQHLGAGVIPFSQGGRRKLIKQATDGPPRLKQLYEAWQRRSRREASATVRNDAEFPSS